MAIKMPKKAQDSAPSPEESMNVVLLRSTTMCGLP